MFVTRLTRRVSLVDQELLTPPEHLSSLPVLSGVSVTQSLVFCVCLVDNCWSFCPFSFGHCVVCSSSIYGLCLPIWYLQSLLIKSRCLLYLLFFFGDPLTSNNIPSGALSCHLFIYDRPIVCKTVKCIDQS